MNKSLAIKQINVTFNDDPEQEIRSLYHEANLLGLMDWLSKDEIPEKLKQDLGEHIAYLSDMFSSQLPDIEGQSPDTILRMAARDIQISTILRERGLARLYRMCRTYQDVQIPIDDLGNSVPGKIRIYQTLLNPDTGEAFTHQEPFLAWFTGASHISRSSVFQRFADLDRLVYGLGLELETAYDQLLRRPSVVGNVLRDVVGVWQKDQPVFIEPDVARRLAKKVYADDPDMIEEIDRLAEAYEENPGYHAMQDLIRSSVPGLRKLVEEVSLHEGYHDARKMVNSSILLLPEIDYYWDMNTDSLAIEIVTVSVADDGEKYETGRKKYFLVSDSPDKLPVEIVKDIVKRLPIKNREGLDI